MALEAPLTEELRADLQQMMVAEPCSFMSSAPAETFVEDPRRASFGSVASKRSLPETAAAGTHLNVKGQAMVPTDHNSLASRERRLGGVAGSFLESQFFRRRFSWDRWIQWRLVSIHAFTQSHRGYAIRQQIRREKSMSSARLLGAFKDSKAQILTHQLDRPEKCPISIWEYHVKGFARKYDRSGHTADTF